MRVLVIVLAVVVALLVLLAVFFGAVQGALGTEQIPRCPEDAVLIGVGDFEHGIWDGYTCGPARDDYTEGAGP